MFLQTWLKGVVMSSDKNNIPNTTSNSKENYDYSYWKKFFLNKEMKIVSNMSKA